MIRLTLCHPEPRGCALCHRALEGSAFAFRFTPLRNSAYVYRQSRIRPPLPYQEKHMEYVNLGATGVKVSRICLGTMTYGSKKGREWVLEEDDARPLFQKALEAGINFYDTADVYSLGVSEEVT